MIYTMTYSYLHRGFSVHCVWSLPGPYHAFDFYVPIETFTIHWPIHIRHAGTWLIIHLCTTLPLRRWHLRGRDCGIDGAFWGRQVKLSYRMKRDSFVYAMRYLCSHLPKWIYGTHDKKLCSSCIRRHATALWRARATCLMLGFPLLYRCEYTLSATNGASLSVIDHNVPMTAG